jgi:hypothetical protein
MPNTAWRKNASILMHEFVSMRWPAPFSPSRVATASHSHLVMGRQKPESRASKLENSSEMIHTRTYKAYSQVPLGRQRSTARLVPYIRQISTGRSVLDTLSSRLQTRVDRAKIQGPCPSVLAAASLCDFMVRVNGTHSRPQGTPD